MGNRVTKSERKRREIAKNQVFEHAKASIHQKRANLPNALVNYNSPQVFIERTKEAQLDRRGKPLNKTDLIAILIKLQNKDEESPDLFQYQMLSNDDLRSYIRLQIYAPEILEKPIREEGELE